MRGRVLHLAYGQSTREPRSNLFHECRRHRAGAKAHHMDMSTSWRATLEQCWFLNNAGETESALALALEMHDKARAGNDLAGIAMSSQGIAWFLRHLGRSGEGVDYIQQARRIWMQLGDAVEQARSGAIFAWLLMEFGDDDAAVAEASDAFTIAQTLGNEALLAFVGDIYAITLNQTGDHEGALELSQSALALARRSCKPWEIAGQLIDRGYIFTCIADTLRETGDEAGMRAALEEATIWNDEAVAVARQHTDFWKLRIALSNGADLYTKLGDFGRADDYLKQWLQVPGSAHGRLLREYDYANCSLLIASGQLEKARSIAENLVEKAVQSGVPHQECNVIKTAAEICEQLGDYKAALNYYKIYHGAFKKMSGDALKRKLQFAQLKREIDDLKITVEHARLRAMELAEEALVDTLTGISNRRAFDRELQRLMDANEAMSLALLDLDHFKLVNDEYSHVIGDDVLRTVGKQLSAACRSGDLVARFGGEEFAFIFKHANALEAAQICERFRAAVEDYPWDEVAHGLRITVSVGISGRDEANGGRALIELADGRLYAAKNAGRNCVVGSVAQTSRPH